MFQVNLYQEKNTGTLVYSCVFLSAAMAELDLSLSDALTDSVPQPGPENMVHRDFVAELEAEHFDDKVGETVGKTDYIPLLDNDDTRAGEMNVMSSVSYGWQTHAGEQHYCVSGSIDLNAAFILLFTS